MDLTDSFLNIEINDLKRKENAYLYLNEQGRNITLNNMNKSGQEFTEKKKNSTLGLNQENLLLKILKNNELIWKKKEDKAKFLSSQNSINSDNHNDVNTHMCNGYLPAHVKEDNNTFLKTSYEVYNMIKYQNIDKYYKTDNLINFYNDKNILNYKKIKRKNENKNKDYIDKNHIYPNDLESNILSFEPNNFSSNYLLESFNNKLVNNYINIHNTDYIEIQDIFDENKLNHVKNKNLCFYKNVDLKKFRKNENNYMNKLMNSSKKKNTTYSHHIQENQIHTKNENNNKSSPNEVEQNVDNLSIYEKNSQVDIINNNISHNDTHHDYIPNNLNDDFIDEIESDHNKIEESKNNISDDIIDFDIDNEFHFNDESVGDKSNKNENEESPFIFNENEENTKNEHNDDEILEDDLIFSEKNSSKLSDKNDSLMDLLNNYDEQEIGDEQNKQNDITFENDNVDDLLDIEFLDEKEKVTDLKNGDEISEQISDFFFEDVEKKEKIKSDDEYCKSGDDKFMEDYELDKNNMSDNMLIMNDIEEDNINDDKDDVENINNVHSQINEEHEIIKDFDLNKEKTDFYNSVVYSFDNNYNNKDNYTHLKQNNNEYNIFKNIYQEYYHTINNDELKNELELFGNHIINNSYIFMLLNYKYIKNYNYNNSIYPFNSDDYTNYLFKNKNLDKNILQNENIIQEVFGINDDIHTQGNNKLKKKIKNQSNLKHMQNLYQNPLFSDPHLLKNFNASPMLRNKNTNGMENESHIINPHDINTDPNLASQQNNHVIVDANGHINNSGNIQDTQNIDHNSANNILDAEQNNIISNMIKHKVNYGNEENDDECSEHFNEKYEHTYHHMNNNKLLKNKKMNELFYMDFNTYLNNDHNYVHMQKDTNIYLGNFTKIMDEFKMEDIQYNEHYIFDKLNNKLLHEVEKNYYISYMLRNLFLKDKKHSDILLKCLIYKPDEYQNVGAINFHNIFDENGEHFRSINKKGSSLSNIGEDSAFTTLEKIKKKNKLIEFDDSYFINNKKDRLECAENILKKTKNIIFFSHLKLDSYYKKNNPHEIENMILSYNNVYVNTQMTKEYYYSFELSNKKGVIAFSRFHKLDFRTGIHKYYHEYKQFNNNYNKLYELEDAENGEDVVPWGWENIEKKYLTQKDEDLIISSYWDYIIPEVAKTHSYFNHAINKFFKLGNRQSNKSGKYLSIGNIDKYENANKYFNASNKNYYIRKTFKNIINILNNENFNFDMHILDAWTIEKTYDHSIFDEDDANENINIDNNVNNKIDDHSSFFYNNSCLLLNDDSPLIILEYVEKDPFILLKLGMNSKINHYFTTKDDESLYSLEYKNKLKKLIEPFGEINVIKDPINYFGVPIKIKKQDQKLTFIENEIFKALLFTIPVYSMHKENEDYPIFDEASQAITNHLDNISHVQENGVLTNIENKLNTSDPIFAENQLDGNMLTNSEVENYSNNAKYDMNENNPPPNVSSNSNKDNSSLFYHTDFLLIRNVSNNGRKYYIKPFYVDVSMCKNVKENNIDNLNMHNYYGTSQMDTYEDQYREGNENYLNINYTNCIFYNVGFLDMHVSTYNPFYKKYIDEKRNYIRSWLIKLIIKHQIKDSKKIKEILKTKLNTFINDKDINAIVKSVDINFILSKEYTDERNNKNSYKSKNVCILECIYHFIQLYKYEGINFKNILEHQDKLNKIIYLLNMEKERANNNIINIKKKMKIIYDKYCYKSEAKSIQFSLNKEDIYIDMIDNYNYVGSHFYDKNVLNYFLYIKYLISCSPWNILKDYSNNLSTSKYGNNNAKQEVGKKKKGLDNKKYESLNKKKNKNKLKKAQQKLKIRKNKQLYYEQKDNDATLSTTSNDNNPTNNSYSDNDFEGYDKKYLKKKKKKDLNQYRKGKMKNKQDSDIFEMSDEENKEQNQVEKKYNKKKKKKEKNKGKHSFSDLTDFSFSEEDNESLDDDKHSNSSSDEKRKKKKKKNDEDNKNDVLTNKKKNKKNYSYAFYLFNHIIYNEKIQQKIGNKKEYLDNNNYNDAGTSKNNAYLKKHKYQQNLKYKGRNFIHNNFFQKNEVKKKGNTNFAKDSKGYTFHGKGKYNFSYFNANKRMNKGRDEFKNETQNEETKKNAYNEFSGIEEFYEEMDEGETNKYEQDINKKEKKKEQGNYYEINNTFNLAKKDKGGKKYMKYLGNNQNLKNKKSKETQNYIDEFNSKEISQNINFINIYRVIEHLSGKDIINILLSVGLSMLNIKKMNKNDQINKLRKYIENGTITNQNKIIYITMIKKIILEQFKNLHSPVYLKYNNNILYLSEKKITNFFNNVDELNKLNNNASTHSGDINIKRTKKVEKNRVRLIKHFFRESINDDSVCSSDMGSSSGSDSQLGGGAHDNEIGKKKKINELLDEEDEEEEKKQLEIIREMQAKNNNIEDNENNYKLIHCLKWTRIYIKKHDNTTSIYEFTEPGENYGNVDANSRIDNYENNYKEGEMNEISPNKSYKYEIMKRRKEILLKNSFKDVEKCLSSENNYIENVQTLYIYGKKNIETFLKWKHFRSLIKKYFILMQNKESEQKNLDAGEINQLNPKQAGDDSYAYNDQGTINDNILFNNGIVKKRKYKKHKKKLLETPESFKTIINIFPTVGDDIKHWNTDKKYSEQNNLKTEKKKLKDKYGHGNEYGKNKDTKKKHLYDLSGDNSGKIINKKFMNTNYSINIKKNNKRYRQNTALKRKDKNVYNTAKSNLSISKKRKGGKLQANQKSYNNDPNNGEQNDEQIESDEYNMIESGKRRGYEDENERKKKKRKKDKLINNTDEHMNKTSSTTEKYVRGSSMVSESSANLNTHNDKNVDESSRKKSKKGNTYNNIKEIIENFNEKLLTIMKDISQVLNYKAFLNQVNETYAPMYYSVIKKPMYINKIIFRCKKRKYNNLSLFIDDVYLIVTNCKLYNTPTSVSAYLRDIVDNMFLDIVNKIKGDDNLQNYNSILIEHFYKNKHFNNTWESINIEQSDLLNNSELSMNKTSDLTINNMQQENLSSNFMASIDQSRNYNNTMDTDFNLNTMSANFNSSNFHNVESDASMNKLKDDHDNAKE